MGSSSMSNAKVVPLESAEGTTEPLVCHIATRRGSLSPRLSRAALKQMLDQQANACYVLITCGQPSEEGTMEVEFTCSGDPAHALYLVESAQQHLSDQLDDELMALDEQ